MRKQKKIMILFLWLMVLSGCGTPPTPNPASNPSPTPPVVQTPAAVVLSTMAAPLEGGAGLGDLQKITVANASQLATQAVIGEGDFTDEIAVSTDGKLLAVATQGGVVLYDTGSGTRQNFLPTFSRVASLDFSPSGNLLAEVHMLPGGEVYPDSTFIAGMETNVPVLTVWDAASGERVLTQALAGRGCGDDLADDLEFSPDGKSLLFRDFSSLKGYGRSDNLCIVSAADGSLLKAIPVLQPWQSSTRAHFSADGASVWVGVFDDSGTEPLSRIQRYEIASGAMLQEFWVQAFVWDLAISQDGSLLAAADADGVSLLSAIDGQSVLRIAANQKDLMSVDLSADGRKMVLGSEDGQVSLWNLPSGGLLWQNSDVPTFEWPGTQGSTPMRAWQVVFSGDAARLFLLRQNSSMNVNNLVQALNVSDGQQLFTIYARNYLGNAVLSPDAALAAFAGYADGRVQVWSVAENKLLFELMGHTAMSLGVAFSPDSSQITSASEDGTLRLWNAVDGSLQHVLVGHSGAVRLAAYSPDGKQLASIGDDAVMRLWDPAAGTLLNTIPTQKGDLLVTALTYAADGQSVYLAYKDTNWDQSTGGLFRVDLQNGQFETLLDYPVNDVDLSADQSVVALDGANGMLTGNLSLGEFKSYSSPMGNGSLLGTGLTPDGTIFLSGNGFGLHLWDAASGELISILSGSYPFGRITVSPDQKLISIAGMDGLLSIWGVRVGK